MGLTAKAGPSGPAVDQIQKRLQAMAYAVLEHAESVRAIKAAVADGDALYVAQLWLELPAVDQVALWRVAPSKGGIFTTGERLAIKEAESAHAPAIKGGSNVDRRT